MEKKIKNKTELKVSSQMIKRLIKVSIFFQVALSIGIYLFTKDVFYSIIFLLGTIVSISGFLVMIKVIDRILGLGKPSPLFLVLTLSKLLVISGVFYLVSRAGESAVLFHILGLSVIVLAIFVEAGYQLYRSYSNGRA